jgi:acetolactate decarboxylase
MPRLDCTLSAGLWELLRGESQKTQEPVSLIVSNALADYFDVIHHTLYQVSTSTALVEGIYQGAVRIGSLREHGNLGLGTFEDLDGEMVVVDGHFFQVRCDGSVREVDDGVLAPFAAHYHHRTLPNLPALDKGVDPARAIHTVELIERNNRE